jgi:hypothetical protein
LNYAKDNGLIEVVLFLENVDVYQRKINELHEAIESNDYNAIKHLHKIDWDTIGDVKRDDSIDINDIFINNLIHSKRKV